MELLARNASRRKKCPGSARAEYRNAEAKKTSYNDTAHAAAIVHLKQTLIGLSIIAINENKEIQEGCELFTNYILNILDIKNCTIFSIADNLEIEIGNIKIECNIDFWTIQNGRLHIFKYDFGFRNIEVFENWEMLELACALRKSIKDQPLAEIEFHIIQPRSFHHDGKTRNWLASYTSFLNYIPMIFKFESEAVLYGDFFVPNNECITCLARLECKTLQDSAFTIGQLLAKVDFCRLPTPSEIGQELKVLKESEKLLKARIDVLETEAEYRIKKGEQIPYFRLQHGYGKQQWKYPPEQISTMGKLIGIELGKPLEVITPKQAIDAGLDESVVNEWSEKIPGALKLVQGDDDAQRIFGG